MTDIFIPILWICINGTCEFMQPQWHSTNEEDCKQMVISQKKKIRKMAEKAKGTIDVLEGTCTDARIRNGVSMTGV